MPFLECYSALALINKEDITPILISLNLNPPAIHNATVFEHGFVDGLVILPVKLRAPIGDQPGEFTPSALSVSTFAAFSALTTFGLANLSTRIIQRVFSR